MFPDISTARLYLIAGLVTLTMFLFVIGAPMAVSHAGDGSPATVHVTAR